MITEVKKWGNSLALRIPISFAEDVMIEEGASVDISIKDKKIIIEPILAPEKYNLDTLLSKISETNKHNEYLMDEKKGKEIW